MSTFKKAEKTLAKLKIALTGPSGSGKTYSALAIASGLGKKIAVIDTENGSASLYADKFEFDTVAFPAPYRIPIYIAMIKDAEAAGYDVLIIDSISHAWAGDGGLLAKKEALDQRGGNSFTNWASITKEHEAFKAALLDCKIHLICTMRSKQDHVIAVNEKGKSVPQKLGLAPIQRDGMEYEFTTVFDLAMDHNAEASKDRTSLFDGQVFRPSKETGIQFLNWLGTCKPLAPTSEPQAQPAEVSPLKVSEEPKKSQAVHCTLCGSPVAMHSSGAGYLCPNWKAKGDGHLRFAVQLLEKYQREQLKEVV